MKSKKTYARFSFSWLLYDGSILARIGRKIANKLWFSKRPIPEPCIISPSQYNDIINEMMLFLRTCSLTKTTVEGSEVFCISSESGCMLPLFFIHYVIFVHHDPLQWYKNEALSTVLADNYESNKPVQSVLFRLEPQVSDGTFEMIFTAQELLSGEVVTVERTFTLIDSTVHVATPGLSGDA